MTDYSFAELKRVEHKFYEEARREPFPPLDKSEQAKLLSAFDRASQTTLRNSREMGLTRGEYLHLDFSLKDTFRQVRIEEAEELHPGCYPDDRDAYINGKTNPEEDEIIYKHAKECRPCLRSLFLLDTLDPGLTGLLKLD